MKRIFLIFFLLALLPLSCLEAHQIKTDKGITVLLHVDPSDEPYSGTTTRMHLAFSSKIEGFKVEDCDCTVYIAPYEVLESVREKGERIDVASMERIYGSPSFSYMFPRHDIYAVVLEGSPKEGAVFEPFRIVYDLRVARGEELILNSKESGLIETMDYKSYGGAGALFLIIAGVYLLIRYRRKL